MHDSEPCPLQNVKLIICLQKALMATQAGGLIQDQNINVHFDGTQEFIFSLCYSIIVPRASVFHGWLNFVVFIVVAPLGVKSTVSKVQKQGGGLGRRKALNDISNSRRPSTLQTSKKHNSRNVISLGEDVGPFKLKSFRGNTDISKAPEKVQVSGGRKALSDLTNSGMPHLHKASKKNHDKKLSAVVEDQIFSHVAAEEKCLHNHQECIKAQRPAVDLRYFLETIGLANGT